MTYITNISCIFQIDWDNKYVAVVTKSYKWNKKGVMINNKSDAKWIVVFFTICFVLVLPRGNVRLCVTCLNIRDGTVCGEYFVTWAVTQKAWVFTFIEPMNVSSSTPLAVRRFCGRRVDVVMVILHCDTNMVTAYSCTC